ncbi:uncharacterized protein LOC136087284 isoform X2 [Hydra vulgaris]|uniref:Uncharacterized protein LOC136087284 isoform X2 n=1 Tax=Hydra vulgaris TaxID=6087 RepID=A0ABM4CV35_HYDVU
MKLNKEMFYKLSDKLSFVNAAEINPYEALSSIDPLNSLTEIQFKKPGFMCSACMMSFTRKDNMKRHALQVHKTIFRDDQSKDKRTPCHYQDCGQVFFQKVKLIKHIEECHEEKNINDPFNEVQFRKYIYDTLCGRCLKNLESGFERLYDICRICKNTSSKKNDWVQCTKYPQ